MGYAMLAKASHPTMLKHNIFQLKARMYHSKVKSKFGNFKQGPNLKQCRCYISRWIPPLNIKLYFLYRKSKVEDDDEMVPLGAATKIHGTYRYVFK